MECSYPRNGWASNDKKLVTNIRNQKEYNTICFKQFGQYWEGSCTKLASHEKTRYNMETARCIKPFIIQLIDPS